MDFTLSFYRRGLPIDRARHKEKGQPMCMEQYYRLFTSYRCPGIPKDALICNTSNLMPEPEHIIVICKNQVRYKNLIQGSLDFFVPCEAPYGLKNALTDHIASRRLGSSPNRDRP